MIYTFTPNPALDISGTVDHLIPNEKNYVHNERRDPGGNGINAARIIHRLSVPVRASGFLGGCSGAEILELLDAEGVKHDFVSIKANTRSSITVYNEATHNQTRLSFAGPQIKPGDKTRLFQHLKKKKGIDLLAIGGSLPPGFSDSDLVKLIKTVSTQGIPVIVDVPAKHLKAVLKTDTMMIKPNLQEFQEATGSTSTSIADVVKDAQKFTTTVSMICVSSVEGGAVLVTPDQAWFGKGPEVQVKGTVGAGDSMVGAMSAAMVAGESLEEIFRWGLAAAVATITTSGTTLGSAASIKKFLKLIEIRPL